MPIESVSSGGIDGEHSKFRGLLFCYSNCERE